LLEIQSKSRNTTAIRAHMKRELEAAGCTVRTIDHQLYARKGTSTDPIPYIVAHADTVHAIVDKARYKVDTYIADDGDIVYYAYDPTTGKSRGVGGDDKVGMWVALEAAYALQDVGIVITIDEEIGALGARKISPQEFENAAVLIQCDRRGYQDAIYETWSGEISSKEWRDHVQPIIDAHGMKWSDDGSLTDVSEIVDLRITTVSAVNLAAGYYGAHTSEETVREGDAYVSLSCALALAKASAGTRWEHEPEISYSKLGVYGAGYDGYGYDTSKGGWEREDWDSWDDDLDDEYHPFPKEVTDDPNIWTLGARAFRKNAAGTWVEDTSLARKPLTVKEMKARKKKGAPISISTKKQMTYTVIGCDVPGCDNEAEDWSPEIRATLCGLHLEDVEMYLGMGRKPEDIENLLDLVDAPIALG
jgi:hypothetical protein